MNGFSQCVGATGTSSVAEKIEEADVDDRARVVVGVDGSECARAALEFALAEAARRGAELEVVSVVPTLEYWPVGFGMAAYSAAMPTLEQIISEVQQETRAFVESVVAEQGESAASIAVRVQTLPGAPAAVLVEQAKGADLLVVGHRGRGGVASALLGSVSMHCLLHAQCPITIVRPAPHPAEEQSPPDTSSP
jgi:nucleotide-binding universal stress UspA family protein